MKAILISTDRIDLDITAKEYDSITDARDAMLTEILNLGNYQSVDELIDDANAGEAGYSDDEAWIRHGKMDTVVWKIIKA